MEKISEEQLHQLNQRFADAPAQEILSHFLSAYPNQITFATSMGAEDQVITHIMAGIDRSSRIFTLDTGRLFQETYDAIERTNARYGINIEIFFPDRQQVEEMVNKKGVNLFYESIENRKLCCHIRKTVPLRRALNGMDAWISGLRRSQAVTRKNLQPVEWDNTFGLLKINPLINWTEEQVWDFINKNNIPYNRLHDKGFRSIGCLPCTRAIDPDDDVRAGRWWWETPEQKECGLHVKKG
jgi:phosphoadenosine phosphosulfate reductase